MPQAMKIPEAKAAVDKEWEKLEKIPAWNLTKVRSKKEVIDEARTKGEKVHFASLMDIYHLKNAEFEAKHQKYKGRVVLRGDIVKDDSGSYAVFTEQGSSASQMTAASVMDIISRLPGYAGQAADAVSAYTLVKMENAQTFGFVYHDTNGQNHGPVWKTQSFLCKYNTSNDVFSRRKSAHKVATGKSDDQLIQYDNKLELGTSYKLKLGPKVEN